MNARELMLSILRKRSDSLRKQEQHIAVAYTNQQLMYEELARKVAQWRATVFAQQRDERANLAIVEQQIVTRHQKRAASLEQAQLQALVIPRAVMEARKDLQQYFTLDRADSYVQKITQALKRVS